MSVLLCLSKTLVFSDINVGTATDLNNAIIAANAGGDGTINFTGDIDLTALAGVPQMRPLNTNDSFQATATSITINGGGNSLLGGGTKRGFFARGGTTNINEVVFESCRAQGGSATAKGGGGAGLGACLLVDTGAVVTASNCTFSNGSSIGGTGGPNSLNAGGGGGLHGNSGFVFNGPSVRGGSGGGGLYFDGGRNGDVADADAGGGGGRCGRRG